MLETTLHDRFETSLRDAMQNGLLWIITRPIRFYQYVISPHFPACCRFTPTCSSYAYDALQKYGIKCGLFLALCRLFKCHPFHAGGYDPLP